MPSKQLDALLVPALLAAVDRADARSLEAASYQECARWSSMAFRRMSSLPHLDGCSMSLRVQGWKTLSVQGWKPSEAHLVSMG